MKLSKMKQLVEWADAQPEKFQKDLERASTIELLMLAELPLSEKQKDCVIHSYIKTSGINPLLMTMEILQWSKENGIDTSVVSPRDCSFKWITKTQMSHPEGFLTMSQVTEKKNR